MYQKKLDKLSNHHLTPISIYGPDVPQNIASLSEKKHAELHSILDMNSRLHYQLVRDARRKTNHKLIMGPDDLKYWHDAQNLYFERVPRLDRFLQKVHLEKMNQLIQYESSRLETIGITHEVERQLKFPQALKSYHLLGLELAKEIQLIFKKGLSLNNTNA